MKTNLMELNNYLFEELERLNDDEMLEKDDNLDKEVKRSKAIATISSTIVNNANVVLRAKQYFDEMGVPDEKRPKMLGINE